MNLSSQDKKGATIHEQSVAPIFLDEARRFAGGELRDEEGREEEQDGQRSKGRGTTDVTRKHADHLGSSLIVLRAMACGSPHL